jgi:hypothetical protein
MIVLTCTIKECGEGCRLEFTEKPVDATERELLAAERLYERIVQTPSATIIYDDRTSQDN